MYKINNDEIKIIVADYDGTIRDFKTGIISVVTIDEIKSAIAEGCYFVMNTGNLAYEMEKSVKLLAGDEVNKFNKYFIGSNGNGLKNFETNETTVLTYFTQEELIKIVNIFEKYKVKNYDITSFDLERIYYSDLDFLNLMISMGHHPKDHLHRLPVTNEVLENFGLCPKITIHFLPDDIKEAVFKDLEKLSFSDKIEYTWFMSHSVDFQVKGTSKFSGIETVLAKINAENGTTYTLNNVIYFGDHHNDLSVFENLKYAIAMENATDEIKNKAYDITTHVGEGGIGAYLQKIKLG